MDLGNSHDQHYLTAVHSKSVYNNDNSILCLVSSRTRCRMFLGLYSAIQSPLQ